MPSHAAHPPDATRLRLVVTESQAEQAVTRTAGHIRAAALAAGEGWHVAEARVRPIEGIGVELRYQWNGELRVSQIFRSWEKLEVAATEKRQELEAKGWHSEAQPGEQGNEPKRRCL